MIGWRSTHSRDYEELIMNRTIPEEDLQRVKEVIRKEIDRRHYISCPACSLPLKNTHVHHDSEGRYYRITEEEPRPKE